MNHSEAVKDMAAERYLLNELSPDARDAFEEHMFDCPECALDVRSGSAFIGEAKAQLPEISLGSPAAIKSATPLERERRWFAWMRPVFAVPVMATLLAVVGYQNLVTLPALNKEASQPHIVQVAPLSGATRGGGSHVTIAANRGDGVALPINLPVDLAGGYASFAFELSDPHGKSVWTSTAPAPAQDGNGELTFSIVLPGRMLEDGTYTLAVSGVGAKGDRTAIERYQFDIALSK